LNRIQQAQDLGLYGDIQRCGGLIRDDQIRTACQGHGNHHALTLTAAELMGVII
jgi:hypothetical protein